MRPLSTTDARTPWDRRVVVVGVAVAVPVDVSVAVAVADGNHSGHGHGHDHVDDHDHDLLRLRRIPEPTESPTPVPPKWDRRGATNQDERLGIHSTLQEEVLNIQRFENRAILGLFTADSAEAKENTEKTGVWGYRSKPSTSLRPEESLCSLFGTL